MSPTPIKTLILKQKELTEYAERFTESYKTEDYDLKCTLDVESGELQVRKMGYIMYLNEGDLKFLQEYLGRLLST